MIHSPFSIACYIEYIICAKSTSPRILYEPDGFVWLAYDALRADTAVEDGPDSPYRVPAIRNMAYVITVREGDSPEGGYSPKMLARFTVSHTKRNQLAINLGVSSYDPEFPSYPLPEPELTWHCGTIDLKGGPYNFDGGTGEFWGEFVFDFTDIIPPPDSGPKAYWLGVRDVVSGEPAVLENFSIIHDLEGY